MLTNLLRTWHTARLRTLRKHLVYEREETQRLRDVLASRERELAKSAERLDYEASERQRFESLLRSEQSRCRELEVDKAIAQRECELLASVVERDHKRIEAETAVHIRLTEENEAREKPGHVIAREI